ncbi:MAG: hypothetical protein U5K55_12845 [Aliarcobacter sp.]|nr:hypothetical protein [Aliarcobacter sp.]
MELKFRKFTETEIKNTNKKQEIFMEVKGNITEQHYKNRIIQLVNKYIERGYSEEQISQMTFYRYKTKVKNEDNKHNRDN